MVALRPDMAETMTARLLERTMKITPIVNADGTQTIILPAKMAFQDAQELEVCRDGDIMTLSPVRSSWGSF